MKSKLTLVALALLALVFVTGCQLTPKESATKIEFSASPLTGKSVKVELPKDLKSTGLEFDYDPATGKVHLAAAELNADASSVLQAAGAATAQANAQMATALNSLVNSLLPLLQQRAALGQGAPPPNVPGSP